MCRSMITGSFVLAVALLIATGSSRTAWAGDPGHFSVHQVGHHGHHRHHVHRGHHHGHYHGRSYGRYYGYGYRPSSFRFSLNLGSFYSGYRSYVPYRSYYVDPYCYGTRYYSPIYPSFQLRSYPYGVYYHSGTEPRYSLPATTQPAELAYGPAAVKQFMGVDRDFALGDLVRDDPKLVLGAQVANKIEPKVRETNWDAHRRALTFMNRGDDAFAKRQFAAALADYDKAITNAPDMPEGQLRRALGLIASGQYANAADALSRAVAIDPDITSDANFELNDLYQGNEQLKTEHLEGLAQAALAAPNDGHLLLLLGAMLHYDRKALRAEKFFTQAIKLGGNAASTAEAFMPSKNGAIW